MPKGNLIADIVVLGAGPAGCFAAMGAKEKDPGARVVIIEKHAKPRYRIGEALLTGTIMTLDEIGIADEMAAMGFHRKIGAAYIWGKSRDPWYVNYPDAVEHYPASFTGESGRYSIHVPRDIFDRKLRDIARNRGVEIIIGHPETICKSADGSKVISATLSTGCRVMGKYWIDATGQNAVLASKVTQRNPVGAKRVATFAYLDNLDWNRAHDNGLHINRTNIISSKMGWIWAIHLGEAGWNLTSLGFVTSPADAKHLRFDNIHEYFPELALFGIQDGLKNPKTPLGEPTDKWQYHPEYSHACEQLHGDNWAAVGDAALFLDPILSQGVTLACHYGLLRGRAAVAHLAGDTEAQSIVTGFYRREAAVLHQVVSEWYDNNRSVSDWKLSSVVAGVDHFGREMDADEAFRWVTNIENVRSEYGPYPAVEQNKINQRLGVSDNRIQHRNRSTNGRAGE